MVFIGLTSESDDAKSESEAFLNRHGITWPNGFGAGDTLNALNVAYLPTVFVIGTDGNIAWHSAVGGQLSDAIDKALGQQ